MYKKMIILSLFLSVAAIAYSETYDDEEPQLKLVKHALYKKGYHYIVKGQIYNPYDKACKNVEIKCYVWKNLMGLNREKYGSIVTESGGLVTAQIDYIPPKTTLDFETVEENAPTYVSITPSNVEIEIYAEWE